MRKRFNVTGLCVPRKHYMVNLENRLAQAKEMVEEGAYFTSIGPGSMGRLRCSMRWKNI